MKWILVAPKTSRLLIRSGDTAVDAINAKLKNIPFVAEAGPHTIAVTFIHRSFAEYEGRLHRMQPSAVGENVIGLSSFENSGTL